MKILVVHNAYQQRGGEDSVVEAEVALLRSRGHAVAMYGRDNHELAAMGRASAALDTLWSRRTVQDISAIFAHDKPDLIHVHNTFPLISPSLYWAAAGARVPVVQTLHNFRLLCPQAMLLRDGKVCEQCVGTTPLAGVVHGCYRGSRAQTAVLAGMLVLHRAIGTWADKVTRFIALNEFCRAKFIEGGLPAHKIVVKPNFVDFEAPPPTTRAGFLFVGRLSPEKGVGVLAKASVQAPGCELTIVGTGPDSATAAGIQGAKILGALPGSEVLNQMCRATALVLPSIWYETFGLVAVEAFACGTPVIASRIGVLETLVNDGVNGLLFEPGNSDDLAAKMRWALANPGRMAEMGRKARAHYEANFTGRDNYAQLLQIYQHAVAGCGATRT
ncbi:MAG: glycosyltransferase family 4 protein [Rhodoferax sp.]|nr:glycosyltransferase family 4 protein [Rhodoferax sp.]